MDFLDRRVDFADVAQRAREVQGNLAHATADLRMMEAVGHSMNGAVAATVSGEGLLADLRIDPSVIDPDDPTGLSELVVAAVNEANRLLGEQRRRRLEQVTGSLGPLLGGPPPGER